MTFIDFFAGIGGFRVGMELAGHQCVGFCEIDPYAVASYTSMHLITEEQREYLSTLKVKARQKEILKEEYRNGEWYAEDISKLSPQEIPRADCWCAGSPCQNFSLAGDLRGLRGGKVACSLNSQGYSEESQKKIDQDTYLLKTLRMSLESMQDGILPPYSLNWTRLGMTCNGKCLTLQDLSHKTERDYSLLDVLEEDVPAKYFLSEQTMRKIVIQ